MEFTARRLASIALFLATALIAGRATAQDWARQMFDHTSHDFGTVARGAKVEHRFIIQNSYLEDAHIKSAKASCGCTTPDVPVEVIKTWQKAYIVVHVNTVNFQGQKDVTIDVEFDKPFPAEVQLSIHCYIRTDVVLDPGSVHLHAAQGSPAQQQVSVRYAGRSDWQIQSVESANPAISGSVTEVSRIGGLINYQLTVRLAADAKVGYSRDELELVTNDPNPRAQRVPVPVEAVVVAPVTVHPSPLIMDPVAAGKLATPVKRPLVIVSATPFRITSVESTDPRFRCELPSGAAATIHRLPVQFLGGDTPGKVAAWIHIQTTAKREPLEAEVSVTVTEPGGEAAGEKPSTAKANVSGDAESVDVDPVFGPPGTAAKPRSSTAQDY